jgi:hypothetical protein
MGVIVDMHNPNFEFVDTTSGKTLIANLVLISTILDGIVLLYHFDRMFK